MKRFHLEYTLDNATIEEAFFDAENEFDAEEQLEEFLSTDDYDLVSVMELAE